LEDTMASKQTELNQKQAELDRLTYGRSQTLAYLSEKHQYDTAQRQYQADLSQYNQWKAEQARRRAERQRERGARHHHHNPGAGNLMPGDLIVWSSNGAISGIHHVAIYIGGGHMVEAPYSGAYVQTASIWEYGGFFGATRPLT